MSVHPVPACTLAGELVADGRDADGAWPAAPMALSGVSVKWGRTEVLAQPSPATATVRLFDPSGTWAAGTALLGRPLTLSWATGGTGRAYFTGRVAGVDVEPHVGVLDGARTHGALLTLACTSLLTDLGNRSPAGGWPAETVAARRARLAALAAGPVSGIVTRPAWDTAPLAAVEDAASSSVLEHLARLFANCGGDRYTYDPDTRAVTYLTRRAFDTGDGLAYLARDDAHTGVYVRAAGGAVDGGRVGGDRTASRDMGAGITRVVLRYAGGELTTVLPGVTEGDLGVRALSVETTHTDPVRAAEAAAEVAALAAGEASGWALQPVTWDVGPAGFDSLEQATALIGGTETAPAYFLGHSWLPDLGIRPLFGVLGGTITYTPRGWSVTWHNAPTTAPPTVGVTWDDLDPTLVWDDEPGPNTLADSVTYADLAFVSSGTITEGT